MGIEVNDFSERIMPEKAKILFFGQASTTLLCLYVSKYMIQVKCSEFTFDAEATFYWMSTSEIARYAFRVTQKTQ